MNKNCVFTLFAILLGDKLLRDAAEDAARKAKFSPATADGKPVKVIGIIVYHFVP